MPIPNTLGFSRTDIRRIQALAEACTDLDYGAALVDLSVPVRVGVCPLGRESYFSGEVLGTWAGRSILVWRMKNREVEQWERMTQTPKS